MPEHPLPILPRVQSYEAEFGAFEKLIGLARTALCKRPEPYTRDLGDRFLDLGLQLGTSAARSCSALCDDNPFWCCVCARCYFEFALRLLWASRQEDGVNRVYSHYSGQFNQFVDALGKADPRYSSVPAELQALPVEPELPDPMPYSLPKVIRAIGDADREEGLVTMFTNPAYFNESIQFLHMFAHANPLFLQGERADFTPHAAHALSEATCALLRAVGYRLGWNQNDTIARVYAVPSFESLSEADRQRLMSEHA